MPKSRRPQREACPPAPIHPTAIYTRRDLLKLLPWATYSGLTTEVQAGRLRRTVRMGRDVYLGQWVIDWLASVDQPITSLS